MRIIISPAKKMTSGAGILPWRDLPVFLGEAEELCRILRGMRAEELKQLWKCSDKIVEQNVERLRSMELRRALTPAILAYEGIQYRYMAPKVFTEEELRYVQEHLRILSGFYGVLKPFDGVTPYRLEMQAKLKTEKGKDLYRYWGKKISEILTQETDCIVDLASGEYSLAVLPHLPADVRAVSCVFGEEKDGKVIEKGTLCKMARGEMVRYMAERGIKEPEGMKSFDRLGFLFDEKRSDDDRFVFLRQADAAEGETAEF